MVPRPDPSRPTKEVEDRLSEALLGGEIHLGDQVTGAPRKGKNHFKRSLTKKATIES